MENNIAVVLVTFNRLDKLKIALNCYEKQTLVPKKMIVVDNASTDGTVEYLKSWSERKGVCEREVVYLQSNTGGAGGFGKGMDRAILEVETGLLEADWIMVSDDDAYPQRDALETLVSYYMSLDTEQRNSIVALSSAVMNNGEIHEAHRSRIEKKLLRVRFVGVSKEEYQQQAFDIDLFSYVGSMIKTEALIKAGTTNKELFIYGDDNEHSLRLKKLGRLVCVPKSIYIHDTPGVETRKIGWHNYYNRRNQLYILKTYFPIRYLCFRVVKRYFADESPLSHHTRQEKTLFKAARHDALNGKLGKHDVYRPGFIIKDRNNK